MALQRPWFGYGFEAFWLPGTIYVRRMWQILQWMPPHAHNGLLELWLQLGLVGVGVFLIGFGYYLFCAIRQVRRERTPVASWPVAFLLFLFLSNLTESHFLVSNNIYFVLYVAVAATLVSNRHSSLLRSAPLRQPRYV
jgi:O-antigen ligase